MGMETISVGDQCENIVFRAIQIVAGTSRLDHRPAAVTNGDSHGMPSGLVPLRLGDIPDRRCRRRTDELRLFAVPAKNALMTEVHESELTILSGEDLLSAYAWNTHRAKLFFCSRCGVYTFHRKRAAPDHFGINVFCLEDFDVGSLPIRATYQHVGGRSGCKAAMARVANAGVTPSGHIGAQHKQKRRLPKETAFCFDHDM
jgi:hypothetical protein